VIKNKKKDNSELIGEEKKTGKFSFKKKADKEESGMSPNPAPEKKAMKLGFGKKTAEAVDKTQLSTEELEAEKLKRKKKARRKKINTVLDRIFGFFLATGIVVGCACLALEFIIIKGPSPALRDTFVATMMETRRFKFIPNIYLSEQEVYDIVDATRNKDFDDMDTSLINISASEDKDDDTQEPELIDYGLVDEDGDGLILEEVKGNGYSGYMLIVLDPSRVFLGKPDNYGGVGLTLDQLCIKYDVVGGINAGGFMDDGGAGLGGLPEGLTIIEGVCYNEGYSSEFVGFDENNILHVGYYSYYDALDAKIRDGVCFGPILIQNGVPSQLPASGVNPRTAIGQRADGAVLMLVIDGRQAHSIGATYQDLVDVMLDFGAVNACNMDGGSSTTLWMNGSYVNSCSSGSGTSRPLPNAFLIRTQ